MKKRKIYKEFALIQHRSQFTLCKFNTENHQLTKHVSKTIKNSTKIDQTKFIVFTIHHTLKPNHSHRFSFNCKDKNTTSRATDFSSRIYNTRFTKHSSNTQKNNEFFPEKNLTVFNYHYSYKPSQRRQFFRQISEKPNVNCHSKEFFNSIQKPTNKIVKKTLNYRKHHGKCIFVQ